MGIVYARREIHLLSFQTIHGAVLDYPKYDEELIVIVQFARSEALSIA
jgi:hypothetical protein